MLAEKSLGVRHVSRFSRRGHSDCRQQEICLLNRQAIHHQRIVRAITASTALRLYSVPVGCKLKRYYGAGHLHFSERLECTQDEDSTAGGVKPLVSAFRMPTSRKPRDVGHPQLFRCQLTKRTALHSRRCWPPVHFQKDCRQPYRRPLAPRARR